MVWLHKLFGHRQDVVKVSVPMWDMTFSRGLLIRCDCGKVWAK